MTAEPIAQTNLLRELEQVVEGELNRHYAVAKEWFPHDYIPWSDGRNFDGLMEGDPWSPEDAEIPDVARSALIVNLLTEDNLPSYHHEIAVIFGRDAAWGEWVHRWTAEEGRHGIAMRDYMLVKRMVDPVELERFRMTHMSAGYQSAHGEDLMRSLAYVSFQELATRVSHRNTGMQAILDVVTTFEMPGAGIPGFQRKAVEMAVEGIYDQRQHHDDVVMPVLRYCKVFELDGLSGEGEKARTELAEFLEGLDTSATRFTEKRDALKARLAARR